MSGFEHYDRELAELDSEIHRYALVCGVDLSNRYELEQSLHEHHDDRAEDKARESLRGLLILRLKVEAEMLELGFRPKPLDTSKPEQE